MRPVGVGLSCLVLWLGAALSQVRRPPRPVVNGCPAGAIPVRADSVANATDYVELARSGCMGTCPAYTVRVTGDGSVSWTGETFVAMRGRAGATIDSTEAKALIQRVADRGFWALCASYAAPITDVATFSTTLKLGGQVKTVSDYGGAAPSWLRALDTDIDRVAGTHRWRHGEPVEYFEHLDATPWDLIMPKVGVTDLMRATIDPDTVQLRKILQMLPDLNARDVSGWTALMYAARYGSLETFNLLLRAGADARVRSNGGESAMAAAAWAFEEPVAKLRSLAGAGLSVNDRGDRGVTPLMIACSHFWWKTGLIPALIAMGADPGKRDADGKTALDYLGKEDRGETAAYQAALTLLSKPPSAPAGPE